jgi:hypothetical protein
MILTAPNKNKPTTYSTQLTCIQCDNQFTGRAGSKFCSKTCNAEFNRIKSIGPEKSCLECSRVFTGRKGSKFCSDLCNLDHNKRPVRQIKPKIIKQSIVRAIKIKTPKPVKIKTCISCSKIFTGRKGSLLCSPECAKTNKINLQYLNAKIEYSDDRPETWIECPVCSLRMGQISTAHMLVHGLTIPEMKIKFPDQEMLSITLSRKLSERVSGSGNPAYAHSGRLSPYSARFIKYKGMSQEEIDNTVSKVYKKCQVSKNDNDNNPMTLAYFIKRGLSEKDAKKALSERQTTFSLDRCIERHGEKGLQVWKDRQDKWLATLNAKSDEEKLEINRKKVTDHHQKKNYLI